MPPLHRIKRVALIALAVGLGFAGVAAAGKPRVAVIGDDKAAVAAVTKALRGKIVRVQANVDPSDVVASATEHRLNAIVTVEVRAKKKKATATVVVWQGKDGDERGRLVVKGPRKKLARQMTAKVWPKLGKAISKSARPPKQQAEPEMVAEAPEPEPAPPVEPEPAAVEETPAPVATASSSTEVRAAVETGTPGLPRITIGIAERPFQRRFRYEGESAAAREYDLTANAIALSIVGRPMASMPGMRVELAGEHSVGVNGSKTFDGMVFGTSASEWSLGAGYDVHFEGTWLGASAGYGEQRFTIEDEQIMGTDLVPDTTYRYVRLGVDAARPIGSRWAITANAGWRFMLDAGELVEREWLAQSTASGLDGALGATVRIGPVMAFLRAEARHYGFQTTAEAGTPVFAKGAADSYLGGSLGVAVPLGSTR